MTRSKPRTVLASAVAIPLTALARRVAATMQRSAQLAEEHGGRERNNGRRESERVELDRAKRGREAARCGRALASRLK